MSFKDDFFEALRSVKKDFFKDYEYTDGKSAQTVSADEPAAQSPVDNPVSSNEWPVSADTENWSAQQPQPEPLSSPVEFEASNESDTIDMDEENISPDVDTRPYRLEDSEPTPDSVSSSIDDFLSSGDTYTPSSNLELHSEDNDSPPYEDGRIIFDQFDSNALDDERTVISKNTVIRGALQTEDSIRMFGQILGDIDCKSNILVAGKVRGNTSAANAYVINAQVDGNLLCDDVVNVTDDAWILGNIRAQQADIDGKVKGNIEIRHTISIGSNSSIIGNISTDELEIKRGAFVNGQVMMYSPSRDVIDRFDRFDQ